MILGVMGMGKGGKKGQCVHDEVETKTNGRGQWAARTGHAASLGTLLEKNEWRERVKALA